MVVDADRMRRNLDATGGGIMAEAVMMGLAPKLGREAAHHAVKHATDRALAGGGSLADALLQEQRSHRPHGRGRASAASPTRPAISAPPTSFIDRVLRRRLGLSERGATPS